MRVKLTRRELAGALAAPLVAAQAPPDETLSEARGEVLRDIEQIRSFPSPMATEPAVVFKP